MHNAPGAISCCDVRPGFPGNAHLLPRRAVVSLVNTGRSHSTATSPTPGLSPMFRLYAWCYKRLRYMGQILTAIISRVTSTAAAKRCKQASGTAWLWLSEHAIHVTEQYSLSSEPRMLTLLSHRRLVLAETEPRLRIRAHGHLLYSRLSSTLVPYLASFSALGLTCAVKDHKQWRAILNLQLVKLRADSAKSTRSRAFTSISCLPWADPVGHVLCRNNCVAVALVPDVLL